MRNLSSPAHEQTPPLRHALGCLRSIAGRAAALTALVNVLALTGTFYLLAIYDFALPAHSMPLLVGLSLAAVGLHLVHGLLDALRSRLLVRGGGALQAILRDDIFAAIQILPLRVRHLRDPLRPVRDLDQVCAFLSGTGTTALLDLPWVLVYLCSLFALHWSLGLFALVGVVVVGSLALAADTLTSRVNLEAAKRNALRLDFCETVVRNVRADRVMESAPHLQTRWRSLSDAHTLYRVTALDTAGAFAGASKAARLIAQSGILGFGTYLAMRAEISAGTMMASSILMSRSLAPIEVASAHWRAFVATHQSYRRLAALFEALAAEATGSPSPAMEKAGRSPLTPVRCSST